MTAPENPLDSAGSAGASREELSEALRVLRLHVNLVALSLLVLAGGLSVFFLREVSRARRQVRELTQIVDHYNKTNRPAMLEIRDRLFEFAKTHPEYYPIFTNFFNPASIGKTARTSSVNSAPPNSGPVQIPDLPEK